MTTSPRSRRALGLMTAGALVLGLAACGDDDDAAPADDTPADTSGDLAAYCDGTIAVDQTFQQLDSSDPAAFQATLEAARPQVDAVLAVVPEEIAAEYEVLAAAYEETVASGDPEAFFTDAVTAADGAVHAYELESCDWTIVEVTAADYHFTADFPGSAGPVSFELTNEGAEPHVMIVARKKDSVDGSALDAFNALEGEEDLPSSFDQAAVVFAEPGASDWGLAELESGEYVAFCPIPVGEAGPPHFTQGMVTEFEVR